MGETYRAYSGLVLYLDTSALLRLYLGDEHSKTIESLVERAEEVYTSQITELEARVSLARTLHDERLDETDYEKVLRKLSEDFDTGYDVVPYERNLARRAGELAKSEPGLRSYDALHLASAIRSKASMVTYDRRLEEAARRHADYIEIRE